MTTWAVETADYRRTAYTRTTHAGRLWLVAHAEVWTGEGWVAATRMVPETPDSRWATRAEGSE